ncbi:hypothetical protein E4T56_gene12714 [Termitomyces sp. T112]|nr:hypothetical protein E4T56_gene12714 [Termitomyces sp. T112]
MSLTSGRLLSLKHDDSEELLSLLLISELFSNLQGAHYFTKLHVCWGYNNVHIQEGDEHKAAFQTNCGLFVTTHPQTIRPPPNLPHSPGVPTNTPSTHSNLCAPTAPSFLLLLPSPLRFLNPTRGLLNQSAIHSLALSAYHLANSIFIFSPDTFPAHLSSHSSHTLLLCTTLPFSTNSISILVDSGTTNNFINKSLAALALQHLWSLPTPILLKLFDSDPTPTGDITHYFQVQLLVTQLSESTLIVLGLSWLEDINPNINWKDLSMWFSGLKASLAAAILLHLQPSSDTDIPDLDSSNSGATQTLTTLKDNQEREESAPPPQFLLNKSQQLPTSIPRSQYKSL